MIEKVIGTIGLVSTFMLAFLFGYSFPYTTPADCIKMQNKLNVYAFCMKSPGCHFSATEFIQFDADAQKFKQECMNND
jgi:hypothetical protein